MNVFQRAWDIARAGAKKFGGKASEYFQESAKQAWAEEKAEVKPEDIPASIEWHEGEALGILTRPQESGMFWVINTVAKGKLFDYIFPRNDWNRWDDGSDWTGTQVILTIMDNYSKKGPVEIGANGKLIYTAYADNYNKYHGMEEQEENENPFDSDDFNISDPWGWLTK